MTTVEQPPDYLNRLLHRWLVQYNPLYLLSATLVLAGTILISRGLAQQSTAFGQVGVGAIAEIYSLALIAGAAFLTRIGQRRPGVMLALLTALYQCDLTLHTETCAYLGGAAKLAALVWFLLFVGKLYAIAWAMQVRLSLSATAIPICGAAGFVIFPHIMRSLDATSLTKLASVWIFAVGTAGLWTCRSIASRVPLDDWGTTALRRTSKAIWILWASLACGHLLFWSGEFRLRLVLLIPVFSLLVSRWIRSESGVWLLVSLTLVLTGLSCPSMFALTAVMSAVVLSLRAFLYPNVVYSVGPDQKGGPYRRPSEDVPSESSVSFGSAPKPVRDRLIIGAVAAIYLAVWTSGWSAGQWPQHILALDLLVLVAACLAVWKGKIRIALLPLFGNCGHWLLTRQWMTAPRTTLGWGIACAGAGFVLLLGCIVTSWRLTKLVKGVDSPESSI